MCGPHRKRPAAEEADDEDEASGFMLSNLPPSAGKASALLKERPDAVKAIAVFIGAAKNAAEAQFANARAKIQKLAKGKPRPIANGHSRRYAAADRRPTPRPPRHAGAADRYRSAVRRLHADAEPAAAGRPRAAAPRPTSSNPSR